VEGFAAAGVESAGEDFTALLRVRGGGVDLKRGGQVAFEHIRAVILRPGLSQRCLAFNAGNQILTE
jgi:hypothetical protein